jgi:tetratricopeptide (TPR) repeat protein
VEAFERVAERFRQEKHYRELFDARLMQKRFELGLPLVSQQAIGDVPANLQQAYQQAYVQAAREVGELLLADGNIPRAWPYFRAIGDTRPVSEALQSFNVPRLDTPEAQEMLGSAVQIAFQEGVNPRKGFELILEHYGLCRAITMFSAYPASEGRDDALRLVLRTLHREIAENLKRAIAEAEGSAPATDSIPTLIAGRPWLFENNAQYTDSSHLAAALRFSRDLEDSDTLKLALEIADYGVHLGPMFQYVEDPPFEQVYEDHGIYLRALLGQDADRAVAHFQRKAGDCQSSHYGIRAAEVLVQLLVRLQRFEDAVTAFRRFLTGVPPDDLDCPSLPQLCQLAGDFEQLKTIAAEQSDPLIYLAALIQGTPNR